MPRATVNVARMSSTAMPREGSRITFYAHCCSASHPYCMLTRASTSAATAEKGACCRACHRPKEAQGSCPRPCKRPSHPIHAQRVPLHMKTPIDCSGLQGPSEPCMGVPCERRHLRAQHVRLCGSGARAVLWVSREQGSRCHRQCSKRSWEG